MYKIIAGTLKLISPYVNLLHSTSVFLWTEKSFKEKKICFLCEMKLLHYIVQFLVIEGIQILVLVLTIRFVQVL